MLKAGVSRADITPPLGLELGGYPHYPRNNTGAHDPLYAACMYLNNGETEIAMVTLDLLFFSKKHVGWMVGALTYFAMDCALLIILCVMSGDFVSSLVDLLFHAWVMYYLISGVRSGFKLQKMPAPEPMPTGGSILLNEEPNGTAADAAESTVAASTIPDSPILRVAGNEEKVKVYVEAQWNGYSIVYRKYGKNTEELVINGNVYAEYVFRGLAKPNTMSATVGGMQISAGYFQRNFIAVNDQIIAASVRWI